MMKNDIKMLQSQNNISNPILSGTMCVIWKMNIRGDACFKLKNMKELANID